MTRAPPRAPNISRVRSVGWERGQVDIYREVVFGRWIVLPVYVAEGAPFG